MNETTERPPLPAPPLEPAKPQHVKREVGQRWMCEYSGTRHIATLVERHGRSWKVEGTTDGPSWDEDRWSMEDFTMTLLAPAPAAIPAAPKVDERATPPKGYEVCPNNRGRWYRDGTGVLPSRNHCHVVEHRMNDAALAKLEKDLGPDWTPPLSAPKAIEAAKPGPSFNAKDLSATHKDGDSVGALSTKPDIVQAAKERWAERNGQPRPKPVPVAPATHCRLQGTGPHVCSGGVAVRIMRGLPVGLYCETAATTRELSIAQFTNRNRAPWARILSNPGVPALIDRRLSHVANCHDDDLVGP